MKRFIVALVVFGVMLSTEACPDLTTNSSCNTGSCSKGGNLASWTIPILPAKPAGISLEYLGRTQWDGQVVRSYYNAQTATGCCAKCKKYAPCKYWLFVDSHPNGDKKICFLYPVAPPTCDSGPQNRAGGKCQAPGVKDDPHFTGAHGTRFDFSGIPGKSFCLLTDRNLHINMKMTGYLDPRTESATVFKDGKAVRSWIRELGILWLQNGKEHSLRLVARNSGMVQRDVGFLNFAEFDGEKLDRLQPGQSFSGKGGLKFDMVAVEKLGPYDVDFYTVKIEGLLDMQVRLRVAHALLRRPEDAEAHISISFNEVATTPIVHGVLGQTYREDREERAIEFSKVSTMLHANIVADGESGKGFLDGVPSDYISSDVLTADCRFTGYNGHVLPTAVA